jgi:tetratricopeptide (TPR) repeat protein
LYLDLKKWPESIKSHEAVLKTYPSVQPYVTAVSLADLEKALKDKVPAESDRRNLAGYYENLAYLYDQTGDKDKALLYLERTSRVNPTLPVMRNIASAYDRKGDLNGAIASLERAWTLFPGDMDVAQGLGVLYFRANQPQKSQEFFRKALKEGDPKSHLDLGVVLYNSKQYKDAMVQFQEVAKLQPTNAEAYYYLGLSQAQSGEKAAALDSFLKAAQHKTDYADAYRELGNIYLDKKDYKNAQKYYDLQDKYSGKGKKK